MHLAHNETTVGSSPTCPTTLKGQEMELRKVFRIEEGKETQVKMSNLRKGDIFRIEPTSKEDTRVDSKEVLKAASNGYLDQREDGTVVGTVEIQMEE
jgi:hypothetical protein